jgi:hemerythrin-like domain-containing protein
MTATEIMKHEHQVIKQVLSALTAAVDHIEAGEPVDGDGLRKAIKFLRLFADRCHHGKEEDRFFPLLQRKGVGCGPGAIPVLLAEHEQGRAHIRALDENLPAAERGDRESKARFCQHAREYVQLLTEHIRKEDDCLFPTADSVLTPSEQAGLVEVFEAFEREEMGEGAHEELHAVADELIHRWGPSTGESPSTPCCHGHR